MMAAFVLGEVWQAESSQAGIKISIFGVFILCSIFFILRVSKSKSGQSIVLEAVCLLFFFFFGFWRMQAESQESKADYLVKQKEQIMVEGILYKIGKTAYYNQYYLKDVEIILGTEKRIKTDAIQISVKTETNQELDKTKEMLSDKEERNKVFQEQDAGHAISLGNRICAKGIAEIPSRATNPGEFDWYLYYRALGIRYQMKTEQVWMADGHINWIREGLERFKRRIKEVYQTICTEKDYGVFCAVLLGEKQELDTEVKSLYEENGISHILAISGLHISLIGMGIYHFLRKRFSFLTSQITAGFIMAAYVVMTGAGVSSVRAYAMFLFLLTAATLGRTYDIAVAAGWIALFLLVRNPYFIYYAGFLLSFGAIIGIGVVGSLLNGYVGSRNIVLKSMISSMSVIWITLPISVYFFFTYAPWSILLNLVVVPCMTLVMVSGIVGGILGIWFPLLGMFGIGIGHYILLFYEKICTLAEHLPQHQILIGRPDWWQIGIYYGMVAFFCVWINWQGKKFEGAEEEIVAKKAGKQIEKRFCFDWFLRWIPLLGRVFVLMGVSVFLIAVLCFQRKGRLEITFLDVSQGDGIFLRLPSGEACLIDGGSSDVRKVGGYRILPFLRAERVECLDFVFISHLDQDHISGVKEILESGICRVKQLCLPDIAEKDEAYIGLVRMAEEAGSRVVYLKAGDQISKDGLSIRCVHPKEGITWRDRNSYSMVLWLQYGEIDFLFTGDIGAEQELGMISLLPQDIEVLKVAHHGSQYSSSEEFLEWVKPTYALISCGEGNSYGHPHMEVLERMEECGTEIFNTMDRGAVTFVSDGIRILVGSYVPDAGTSKH